MGGWDDLENLSSNAHAYWHLTCSCH